MVARMNLNCLYRQGRAAGVILALLAAALPANGHAILKESQPAVHSVVSGPNIVIRLKFNSRIDAAHSRVYLDNGSHPQPIEIEAQPAPDILSGHANGVKAGEYRIQWQVLAVDGHITRGEVPFTVR
jgi:copper resistance protein C